MTTSANVPAVPGEPVGEANAASARRDGTPPPADPARSRSFVAWLLALCIIAISVIVSVNWWLDPIGVTGRNTRFTSTQNGVVRAAKLDLMDALKQPPDVLILGSSRSMKLDPVVVEEVTGKSAFNAGVSGGRTKDSYLFAAYAAKLWPETFPHLVIGVTNDMFHRASDERSLDDRLRPLIPEKLSSGDRGAFAATLTQLSSLSTTKASLRTARIVVRDQGASTLLHPEGSTGIDALRGDGPLRGRTESLERGMQVFDPGTAAFNDNDTDLRVELQMNEFIRSAFKGDPNFTGVDQQGLDYFEELILMANKRGDVPTVWITPYHPRARAMLPPEYDERDRKFRRALTYLRKEEKLRFTVLDYEDPATFGGDDDQWFDGIHMKEPNTRRVIEQLHRDGAI